MAACQAKIVVTVNQMTGCRLLGPRDRSRIQSPQRPRDAVASYGIRHVDGLALASIVAFKHAAQKSRSNGSILGENSTSSVY